MSAPLLQSQWSNTSAGSVTTRTLTSSSQSQHGDKASPVGPQRFTDDGISNDSHQDIDTASYEQKTDILTRAMVTKVSTSVDECQQDGRTSTKVDGRDLGKEEEKSSSVPLQPTIAKKDTSAKSHSLGKQRREGVGFAEHHLARFYSSQTAAAAAALRSGFTDNEISNDAVYEIQTDSVPEKKDTPSPEREQEMEDTKPSGVTAMNASDSQDVEVKEQDVEDLAHHQDWGRQFSEEDDATANEDHDIENPGISKALPRDSPSSMPGMDSHIRSLDVPHSKGALNTMSASPSVQSSVMQRVNRMEQVLDDVKQMTSEGQQTLESRLDRLEGMVEKLLQMVTTQKKDTPTTPSGSGPSSLQDNAHYRASGCDGPTYSELASGSFESFRKEERAKTDFYEQKRGYPKETFGEEPPSYGQYGRTEKPRKEDFQSPEEELQPPRLIQTFKGDAYVRPKQRPSTSRHQEDLEMGRTGTEGVHTETTKGKKGGLAEARDTYGDTRRQEAGTAGQDGGIRVYAGELRQDSGGRGGIETDEVDLEYTYLEESTHPKQSAGKESSQPLSPQPSALDDEDLGEDSVVELRQILQTFSAHTVVILKNLHIVTKAIEINSDPVAFRLATALEKAIFPGSKPRPPLAKGHATVLVLDNSESMKGKPLQQAVKFANDFLNGIERLAAGSCKENVAIVTIGGGAKVLHHFSNDYNGLRSALEDVRAEGRSPFREGILVSFGLVYVLRTVVTVGRALSIRPRVIFVTDGKLTDESQPHGPDTSAASPEAKAELIQLLKSILAAPISPRPFLWVPVHDADRVFMDSMADIPGNGVFELDEIHYMTHNYRLQLITGHVMNCILDLPKGPDDLIEAIRSHIEVFQPNLPKVFKEIVLRSVVKHLAKRQRTMLAMDKMAGERRAAEREAAEKRDAR